MANDSFQPPRGTRDLLPKELSVRNRICEILSGTAETYGFGPIDTPVFENFDFLAKKSGPEVKEQIYYFKDKAGRELGLRFDFTVPIARLVMNNPQLPKPLRLYVLDKAWRYEEISAGRFREFSQLDVEILGSKELIVDAETIAVGVALLTVFGIPKIKVKINNREILDGFAKSIGISEGSARDDFFRTIDKREKLSESAFREALGKLGLSEETAGQVSEYCGLSGEAGDVIKRAEKLLNQNSLISGGIEKLKKLFSLLKNYGVEKYCELDLSIARGLDYYTGIIFEVKAGNYGLSIIGGGRYDKLIGLYSGEEMPATGFAMGIDRLYELLGKEGRLPASGSGSKALVVPIGEPALPKAIELVQGIRLAGVNSEIDVMGRSVGKNLEFADKAKMPFAVIVGEKELSARKATVKDLRTGESEAVDFAQVPFYIAGKLSRDFEVPGKSEEKTSAIAGSGDFKARLHTADHILTGVLGQLAKGFEERALEFAETHCRWDCVSDDDLRKLKAEIEKSVNEIISRNLQVSQKEIPRAEAEEKFGKLRAPKELEEITVYEIAGFNELPCGGPHVRSTAQVGKFKILKIEKKGAKAWSIRYTVE
ncbi:MAG: histidine--tRNA ligase [archaeon]